MLPYRDEEGPGQGNPHAPSTAELLRLLRLYHHHAPATSAPRAVVPRVNPLLLLLPRRTCMALEKPRPARMEEARTSAVAASISSRCSYT